MIVISSDVIFSFTNFCVTVRFFDKLLTLGILLSIAVRTVVVAKLVILFLTPFILALRVVLVAKLVILRILSSISEWVSEWLRGWVGEWVSEWESES